MGTYGGRLGWGVTRTAVREYAISPVERSRRERWRAVGRARVVSKKYGAVVVPCRSKLTALMNAAAVTGQKYGTRRCGPSKRTKGRCRYRA